MTDRPIPAELLRDQLQALAALARRLCRDPHDADDAVQDTLVTALLRPAPRTRLRSWLAAILHNRVRQDARAGLRRRARLARAGGRDPAPATADVVAELALHRRLVELVHALDEPLRHTLFLRFWRGLSPRDIATLTAAPVATVHARIERALARLRVELDAGPGGRGWAALLLALPARPTLPGLASALLMKTKVLFVAAVVAVLAVLPFVDLAGGTVAAPTSAPAKPAALVAAPVAEQAPQGEQRAVQAVAPLPPPTTATGVPAVMGFVRDLDGNPIAGIAVRFERTQREGTLVPDPDVPAMTTAGDGSFTLAWPGREGWLVGGSAAWCAVRRAWCAIEPPAQPPVVLMAPARRYAGSVVDADGVPVAGARASVVLDEHIVASRAVGGASGGASGGPIGGVVALPNDLGSVAADAQGHFALGPVGFVPGMRIVAEHSPFAAASLALPAVDTNDLLLRLGAATADPHVHGVVLDPSGGPAVGAYVAVGGESVRAARDGRFAVPWPWGGKVRPTRVTAVMQGVGAVAARLLPGVDQPGWHPDRPITLRLPAALGVVAGRVIDRDGAPVAGVHVWTPDLTWFGNVVIDYQGHQLSSPSSVEGVVVDPNAGMNAVLEVGVATAADGTFTLRGLQDRSYAVFAMAPGTLAASGPVMATPGDQIELRLEAQQLRAVTGRIVDDVGGKPLAGVRVSVGRHLAWQRAQRVDDPWSGSPMQPTGAGHLFGDAFVVTDADGRFALPQLQRNGAYLGFAGDLLFLAPPLELDQQQEHGELAIALPARSTFHLQLVEPGEADAFSVAAPDGQQRPLFQRVEGAEISIWRVDLVAGRSAPAYCRAGDALVVLSKAGKEVRRVAVSLPAGSGNEVRL